MNKLCASEFIARNSRAKARRSDVIFGCWILMIFNVFLMRSYEILICWLKSCDRIDVVLNFSERFIYVGIFWSKFIKFCTYLYLRCWWLMIYLKLYFYFIWSRIDYIFCNRYLNFWSDLKISNIFLFKCICSEVHQFFLYHKYRDKFTHNEWILIN